MGAKQIIVEKSRPNRKEIMIISVKLQPNVIHSKVGVIRFPVSRSFASSNLHEG